MLTTHHDSGSELPFTGERYVPSLAGGIALEHWHRYILARSLAAGKAVLDIASGEGYGSAFLAETAASVIGVDISAEAVEHAKRRYPAANLEFRQGSCAQIPVADASVDLVVSFETIEHHDQHREMMAEIRRVLKPDGILVMSSPDRLEYSEVGLADNEHHVKELSRGEFEALLRTEFPHLAMFGQRVVFASGIFAESGPSRIVSYTVPQNEGDGLSPAEGMPRPLYLVAVASAAPLPDLAGGLLEQRLDLRELAICWQKIEIDIEDERVRKIGRLERTIVDLTKALDEKNAEIERLTRQTRGGFLTRLAAWAGR